MNRSTAANVAQQARRRAAANRAKMDHYENVQSKCEHKNTENVQGDGYNLTQCSDCGLYL